MPALANQPVRAQQEGNQPVTLTDEQLDSVTGGDLLGLNLNSLLTTVNSTLQATQPGHVVPGYVIAGNHAAAAAAGFAPGWPVDHHDRRAERPGPVRRAP